MRNIPPSYLPVAGTERAPRNGARRIGPANPREQMSLSIRLRRRTDARIRPFSAVVTTSLSEQKRLSRERFAASLGASEEDLRRIARFAREAGLVVVESSAIRRTVVVSGSVEQVNRAFGVDLGRYESTEETYRGREGPVHVPGDLVEIVEGIFGMDNRRMARRAAARRSLLPSLTPRQVAEMYNFPLNFNASSQTIGLIEFGGGYRVNKAGTATDIQAYFDVQGLTPPVLFPVCVDGATNNPKDSGSDPEVVLDIEVAGAVAQGAKIAVFFAPFTEQGWVDIMTTAVLESALPAGWAAPSVISISWAWAELEPFEKKFAWTEAAIQAVSQTFEDAARLGVTVIAASGDNGTDCQIQDGRAHVYYPASDPWVTTVGGTSISNVNGPEFTESTWNDHQSDNEHDVTGGGVSDVFPPPWWQVGTGIPPSINDGHWGRGIPDIAGYANGYKIFLNGSMQGPFVGTSEAAPLYAGLIALMNAVIGDSVGYLNPMLYSLGGTPVFRDIADGETNADGTAPGYHAIAGWDACTGWGSVDGNALLDAVQTYLFSMLLPTLC